MKVKEMYTKLRQIDNHIDETTDLIMAARTSGTGYTPVESEFLQTIRKFLSEYKNILEDMEIKEVEE